MLVFVAHSPISNVLIEFNAILPVPMSAQTIVFDAHCIANTLPECANGTDFHVGKLAPLTLIDPGDRLSDKDGECIQKTGLSDGAAGNVMVVKEIHAGYGF